MIIPALVRQRFELAEPYIYRVSRIVRDIVFAHCEERGFAFLGRKKTLESAAEKIETGRFARWSELDDLYGCTIIVPTLAEEKGAIEFLSCTFEVVELRLRGGTMKQPDVFRFDSTRFIGKLKLDEEVKRESELCNILFEIQIRTAFEHAWLVATRTFAYKADQVNWRRFRLAAQLKASVEQLDALVVGFDAMAVHLSEHEWPVLSAKRQLEVMLKKLVEENVIPNELAPESWTRLCDTLWTLVDEAYPSPLPKKVESAQKASEIIEKRMRATGGQMFPRSITLLQFSLGTLVEEGVITKPIRGYTPLITQELLDHFPSIKRLGSGFEFDETKRSGEL